MSVSDDEQERRFQQRVMMEYTDIPEARWYQIDADDKRRAHLNSMSHLLSMHGLGGVGG